MVKNTILILLLVSCSLYNNSVDPMADSYQGYESVNSLNDITPVSNSFTNGKAVLVATEYKKAETYDYQIRYEDSIWEDSYFYTSENNFYDISSLEFDYTRSLYWRVRGNRGDINGEWSNESQIEYSPIALSSDPDVFNNFIYISCQNYTWGNSWEIEYIAEDNDPVIVTKEGKGFLLSDIEYSSLSYRVREANANYKGFWSSWKSLTKRSDISCLKLDGENLLYGEFEVSNRDYVTILNTAIESELVSLTINEEGVYKGENLLLDLNSLDMGYQKGISFNGDELVAVTGKESLPVVGVNLTGAIEFTNILNAIYGYSMEIDLVNLTISGDAGFRLPYSEEWETMAQNHGGEEVNKNSNSLIESNSSSSLLGNAWEWCLNDNIVKGGSFKEVDDLVFTPEFNGYRSKEYTDESVGLRVVFAYEI